MSDKTLTVFMMVKRTVFITRKTGYIFHHHTNEVVLYYISTHNLTHNEIWYLKTWERVNVYHIKTVHEFNTCGETWSPELDTRCHTLHRLWDMNWFYFICLSKQISTFVVPGGQDEFATRHYVRQFRRFWNWNEHVFVTWLHTIPSKYKLTVSGIAWCSIRSRTDVTFSRNSIRNRPAIV